jgi:DNA-directed RNA polymerase subunit RPC12/RpoP
MMGFFDRMRQTMQRFMVGRYGIDPLGRTLIWFAFALILIGNLLGLSLVVYISFATYIFAFFRVLSRRREARLRENALYLQKTEKLRTGARQGAARFQNRKAYRYFRCPKCRTWLRLPRGVGAVKVTCRQCGHGFDQRG